MRTVLAALVTLATATAGPATRPAPTSAVVDRGRVIEVSDTGRKADQ